MTGLDLDPTVPAGAEPAAEPAQDAARALAAATGVDRHDVAVVLGSGWVPPRTRSARPTRNCR